MEQTVFFTALHCMQRGLSDERLSVRLSLCLSNAWIVTKRKHLAKKVQIWLIGSRPRAFLRWTAYVAPNPPKGASKTTIFSFSVQKIGLSSKKVCYKVSLCENFQRQSCKAFIGLSIRAQMVGGDVPLYLKFWIKVTDPLLKRRFPVYIRT